MTTPTLRTYQHDAVEAVFREWETHASTMIVMATGLGKCFGRGTPIMLFDGTIKPVESIEVGDILMGWDSTPRRVISTCSGYDTLYCVTPTKGDPYIVNSEHILSLRITGIGRHKHWVEGLVFQSGGIANIPIRSYLSASKTFKHVAKGWRMPVESFSSAGCLHANMPPYMLGLWLGDGHSRTFSITTKDKEIVAEVMVFAAKIGMRVRSQFGQSCPEYHVVQPRDKILWGGNVANAALRDLGVLNNKHIPHSYLTSTWANRNELLAGLIDSDGSKFEGGYEFVSISRELSDSVAFLARSLGLAAFVKKCVKKCQTGAVGDYWRVQMSGHCEEIPCRVKRKQPDQRKQKKNPLRTGISVCKVGHGEYFGFTLEGPDRMFLLGDFTVAHNTVTFCEIIRRIQPKRAIVIAHRSELIQQAANALEKIGLRAEIEMDKKKADASMFHNDSVIVASVQTLISGPKDDRRMKKFRPEDFACLVVDECFPAGTLVDGRPVEDLRIGDCVNTVLPGYKVGFQRISGVFKRKPHRMVSVHFSDGSKIACTPEHPFWSDSKKDWILAVLLDSDDVVLRLTTNELSMQELRKTNGTDNQVSQGSTCSGSGAVLQSRMLEGVEQQAVLGNDGSDKSEVCLSTHEGAQSNESSGNQGEGISNSPHNGPQTDCERREWATPDGPTENTRRSLGMDSGVCDTNKNEERLRVSDVLQSRPCQPEPNDRRGGGREFSSHAFTQGTRPKEGGFLERLRVDRIEVHEQTSDGTFGGVCPGGYVYNIEVEYAHHYFANGILVHNCHHSVASSYREVLEHFKSNPSLKVLGVSATPDRLDSKALGMEFQSVAYKYDIAEAIEDGYLVPIEQQMIHTKIDYSNIRTTAGDLNGADLAQVMEDEAAVQGMVGASIKIIGNRPSIAFTSSVRHAEMCCEIFNRHRPGMAAWICGETPAEERSKVLRQYKAGEIQVIANVGIATEGFDAPNTQCIIIGRPTKSRALYTQMVGRGTRALAGTLDELHSAFERREAISYSLKPSCIAEGTLILTDHGLVPIEYVTSEMKCWDGVDFVTNLGVVFRGEQNVITYAGLTATEDHRVWTKEGWKTFGECAAKQIPISVTALGWKEVREADRYYRGGAKMEGEGHDVGGVRVRGAFIERLKQHIPSEGWLSEVWTSKASSKVALQKMPSGAGKVYEPKTKTLSSVWWSGHSVQFLVPAGDGHLGSGELGAAQRTGSGSNRKRRSLRSWEPSMGHKGNSSKQQAPDSSHTRTARLSYSTSKRRILRRPSEATYSTGNDVEGDSGKSQTEGAVQRKVKVFDILNCGPRHRFTAAGLLVSNCLVLDFVGNSGKHKLITTADILGGKYDEEVRSLAVADVSESGGAVRMADALKKVDEKIRERIEQQKRAEAARKAKLIAQVQFSARTISPFDVFQITPRKDSKWDSGKPLTENQKAVLRKMGVNPDELNYAAAKQILHKHFERIEKQLCSFKQGKVLMRSGYTSDEIKGMTFREASSIIDILSKNNWKRVDQLQFA